MLHMAAADDPHAAGSADTRRSPRSRHCSRTGLMKRRAWPTRACRRRRRHAVARGASGAIARRLRRGGRHVRRDLAAAARLPAGDARSAAAAGRRDPGGRRRNRPCRGFARRAQGQRRRSTWRAPCCRRRRATPPERWRAMTGWRGHGTSRCTPAPPRGPWSCGSPPARSTRSRRPTGSKACCTPGAAIGTERALRERLAELEARAGAWRSALALLRDSETLFPEEKAAIHAELADMFAALLRDDTADALAPLELVSVVEENADLLPTGAEGDALQGEARRPAGGARPAEARRTRAGEADAGSDLRYRPGRLRRAAGGAAPARRRRCGSAGGARCIRRDRPSGGSDGAPHPAGRGGQCAGAATPTARWPRSPRWTVPPPTRRGRRSWSAAMTGRRRNGR